MKIRGFFEDFADRMIFAASRDHIDPENRTRVSFPFSEGEFEAWVIDETGQADPVCPIFGLKFPGTGGRAERGGPHPCELLSEHFQTWTINPPGYGTSDGRASLRHLKEMCDVSWKTFAQTAGNHKKIVIGNSLGTMYALYVAANYPVDAVFLRNPVPLEEIIRKKYSWWNFGLGSRFACGLIPKKMNAIENAARCKAPVFCISSQKDQLIPVAFQQKIFDAFQCKHVVFKARDIDHHEPIVDEQVEEYEAAVKNFFADLHSIASA